MQPSRGVLSRATPETWMYAGVPDASVASISSVLEVEASCQLRACCCAAVASRASENTYVDIFHPDKKPRLQQIPREERLAARLRVYLRDQSRPGRKPRMNDRGVDHELDLLVRRLDPAEMAEILDGNEADETDSGEPLER